ncbi:protein Daple isoform X1 [Schistocerca cancellata]|uniref:protein Daple isoform X1 n=1 Tax=Schistocerca cancellata TaxID=274614 RepID=UPI002118B583|nr:protein Daple isoform X1 [Schistocerca cancellata]
MATSVELEEFMSAPLVKWFYSCLENEGRVPNYEELVDGVVLYEVLLQIDPEPVHHGVVPSVGSAVQRIRNLDIIIRNIKTLYEEELGQIVLVLPDCIQLGQKPNSKEGLDQMKLLLLLLLGCAVQCPNKETFIERIRAMDVTLQHGIVDCIKQVTENPQIVLIQDATSEVFPTDLMLVHLKRLAKERDEYLQGCVAAVCRPEASQPGETTPKLSQQLCGGETHHLAVELADWKSRLRKQRQELEEKTEALAEAKEELEYNKVLVSKLKLEIQELVQDARAAKVYRDELDAVRERAERVDKLEQEVQRYREKMTDIEFYKTRVDELREDNRVLMETREMLEEQLQHARKRGDRVLELEAEIIKYRQHVNELTLDCEASKAKLQEVFEENAQLQLLTQSFLNESNAGSETDSLADTNQGSADNSLSEQLSSSAQARALKLELENRRLLSTIDSLRESSFHETNTKILEIEKEKKRLSLKVEQYQETCKRLNQQTSDLEKLFKESLAENKELQDVISSLKQAADKNGREIQAERAKVEELEKAVESLSSEKKQLLDQLESCKERLEGQQKLLESMEEKLADASKQALLCDKHILEAKSATERAETSEKESQTWAKEVAKLRDLLEEKDKALDQCAADAESQRKEVTRLTRDLEEASSQIMRLLEVERESQELASRSAIDKETLSALQADLVQQKLGYQQLRASLEKLGIEVDRLTTADSALDIIISSSDVKEAVRELLLKETEGCKNNCSGERESVSDRAPEEMAVLQEENATLQVELATLRSQVTSLSAQHTALQLANSQLVAEKDEMVKERGVQQELHEQLIRDQVTLQTLHEHLSEQFDKMAMERESLRGAQRDLRSEVRSLREMYGQRESDAQALQRECDRLKAESRSLTNLRAEHSSLKDDFRNLFTANEKLKQEYRNLQEEHRSLRSDSGSIKLRATEMQGELAVLEVELAKMTHKCELLQQMNASLEDDRRALMENVSHMFSQYHELLTLSLEDKEHYHQEEKIFTDKFNNLCRQKEKLEEKIMDHYRKLDSCSSKKKGFGATFVKRVKKAGSDLISKVPRSRQSWHEDSQQTESQGRSSVGPESSEGGNDSDVSTDDMQSQRTPRTLADNFTDNTLSLGTAGTRRAVYYTEESNGVKESGNESYDQAPDEGVTFNNSMTSDNVCPTTPQQDPRSVLVYNRISTVIGAPEDITKVGSTREFPSPSHSSSTPYKPDDSKRAGSKGKGNAENSTWYEYGCV